MAVITLTSDLGLKDHYVGSVKGVLLSKSPGCTVVDVSHEVKHFDMKSAAMLLRNSYQDFPQGSIHIVSVDPDDEAVQRSIIIKHNGHFFVGPDNGVFSLTLREEDLEAYEITGYEGLSTFPMKDIYAPAAAALASGQDADLVGKRIAQIVRRETIQPVQQEQMIRGSVSYVDGYGNVITNITRSMFEDLSQGRQFFIKFNRYDHVGGIDTHYSDQTTGEIVVMFNSSGLLEICINKGNASDLLGLREQDSVQIEFQ